VKNRFVQANPVTDVAAGNDALARMIEAMIPISQKRRALKEAIREALRARDDERAVGLMRELFNLDAR